MFPRRTPYENNPPLRDNILSIGFPGITSSRAQLSRYVGEEGVTVLYNWSDVYQLQGEGPIDGEPTLYMEDKDKNRNHGRSKLSVLYYAIKALWTGKVYEDSVEDEKMTSDKKQDHTPVGVADPVQYVNESNKFDTGEASPPPLYRATCRVGVRLLHNLLPSPEVQEMVHLHRWRQVWDLLSNPIHLLLVIKEILTSLYFSVTPMQFCYSEPGRTNMGGVRDQQLYQREVRRAVHLIEQEVQEGKKKRHLVLFGVSRGAATCFYASMKLPPKLASYVSLVMVEAPFDSLQHVLETSSWMPNFLYWFFTNFCNYRGSAEELASYTFDVHNVHLRCPVAFVISLRDRRVPNENTQVLIDTVRNALVPHVIPAVEVLVLKHSRHPCMPVGHKEDQDAYAAFVERLYDTYCP
ncbi:hypothetical protein, conserved [Angomonas deanei]|uniref:Alpha/beta hydrolase family n=1 Tax=Angomonas deanei TaxID=59799 RepID=A0A7G2CD42_9TRYP|nr:hypothetical protein, conserved [Angomonas deanei]